MLLTYKENVHSTQMYIPLKPLFSRHKGIGVQFTDEPTGALNRTASNEVMEELVKLNEEGTTIMMVTHDAKGAAKCSRVLYIVDGNIKGEYISPRDLEIKEKDRERMLNNWLLELGW